MIPETREEQLLRTIKELREKYALLKKRYNNVSSELLLLKIKNAKLDENRKHGDRQRNYEIDEEDIEILEV